MATKRYYIGRLPDIHKGDSFPLIQIRSQDPLSGWNVKAEVLHLLGLVIKKKLTLEPVTGGFNILPFIENFGNGDYALRLTFTSPGGFKTSSFEGKFSVVRANSEIKKDDAGIGFNISVQPSQVISLEVTAVSVGGGSGPSGPVSWDDVTDKPDFSEVATTGQYTDLEGKPTIPQAPVNPDWNSDSGLSQILNKPSIPAEQVNSDWNADSGKAQILNKPTIPAAQQQVNWNAESGITSIANKPADLVNEGQLAAALAIPAMFLGSTLQVTKWLKPDGVTETVETDPEAIPQIDVAGEVLPAPIFATPSKTATSLSQSISNLPSGASVVWTVDGVVDAETGATLSKSGLTAEQVIDIEAYFTKPGSANSAVSSTTITTNPDTGYAVDRRWYVNTKHNFGDDATDAKWNNITLDEGTTSQSLTPQLGTGTISMIAQSAFDGSENAIGAPGSALYEDAVINSSWNYQQDGGSSIRLTGLDNAKYYQIYVGTYSINNSSQQSLVTVAGEQNAKTNYQTWGTSGENEFASNFYTVFNNKQATGGAIDILFNASNFYQNRVQAIIIEESSTPKP